ncbi:hypothetical protein BN2476_110128 [Paraburkholderia piptadeniae]|uniref:Uncharacterized protein n=1 Tax=Paraburkholderia piptadeniae TaxID=1701573 RepID=A0A1N7RPV7_9BURK|nr:hypothetical protein BN2476_110128 [Paraburkholderia piptadeniae]
MADAGRAWHSDMCYVTNPPRCSLLYALEVPHDDANESDELIARLLAHMTKPEFVYRHRRCKRLNGIFYECSTAHQRVSIRVRKSYTASVHLGHASA